MVPNIKITPIQHGSEYFWNIQIKCKFPKEIDVEKQRSLKKMAKKKGCDFRCNHVTDREGLSKLIAAIQDDLPHYEFKYIEVVNVTRNHTNEITKIGKRMKK